MAKDPTNIDSRKIYSVREAAVFADVTDQTIRRHIWQRKLKANKSKASGRYDIRGAELRNYIMGR